MDFSTITDEHERKVAVFLDKIGFSFVASRSQFNKSEAEIAHRRLEFGQAYPAGVGDGVLSCHPLLQNLTARERKNVRNCSPPKWEDRR